jgi:ribosomal protein S18 acetylase RimI-like enzyme
MTAVDLAAVSEISGEVHAALPERPEVFAEKFRLFPKGCFVLDSGGEVVGYAFSYPWLLNSIPPLDAFLEALPPQPNCLYLHDAAVRPQGRGKSAAAHLVSRLRTLAAELGLSRLALVSVYGTHRLWTRFGVSAVDDPALFSKLAAYGPGAKYMIAPVREGAGA